jgi:hypothetical protein
MTMNLTMDDFISNLSSLLSPLVKDDRTVMIDQHLSSGGIEGKKTAHVTVTFINLPYGRVKERRGGGAEAENNRIFFVRGFNGAPHQYSAVEKVQVEQLVNNVGKGIGRSGHPNLKKKTSAPYKIASYLAIYMNQAAADNQPNFTHE